MTALAEVPVAVLAGGLATRLWPITRRLPKALVPVAGRPFIDHQLALLRRRGLRQVVLCLGFEGRQVEEHLQGHPVEGMGVEYAYDGDRLLGTGGALRRGLPRLGPLFFVLYGDSYTDVDFAAILRRFESEAGTMGLMTVLRNEDRWDRSNVVFEGGRIRKYDKRERDPAMRHIDYGVGLLRAETVKELPAEAPSDLADLYRSLIERGVLMAYEVDQRFYEIGSPAGLQETAAYLTARMEGDRVVHD